MGPEVLGQHVPVVAVMDEEGNGWCELRDLALPVAEQRRGADQQCRRAELGTLVLAVQEQGQHLDGLAETHVIGQDAAETQASEAVEPGQTAQLIGPQLAPERGGLGDGLVGQVLQFSQGCAEIASHFHLDGFGNTWDACRAGQGSRQRFAPGHALETRATAGLDDRRDLLEGLGIQGHPLALPGHQRVLEARHLRKLFQLQLVVAQHEGPVGGDRAV